MNVKNFFKPAQNQKPAERRLIIQNYTLPGNMRTGAESKTFDRLVERTKETNCLRRTIEWEGKKNLETKKTGKNKEGSIKTIRG